MGGRAHQKSEPDLRKLQELESAPAETLRPNVPVINEARVSPPTPRTLLHERHPPWCVAEQVRKWGMRYDGQTDPLGFVEVVEERAITYGIELDWMQRVMSEIFSDKAAKWLLTSGLRDATWTEFNKEFLDFFLPP